MNKKVIAISIITLCSAIGVYIAIQPRSISILETGFQSTFHVVDEELVLVVNNHGELYKLSEDQELNQVKLSQDLDYLRGIRPLSIDDSHFYGHFLTSLIDIDINTGDVKITEMQVPDVGSAASVSLEPVYGSDRTTVFTWTIQDPTEWTPVPAFGREHGDANRITQDQDENRFLEKVVYYAPNSKKPIRQKLILWDTTDPTSPLPTKEVTIDSKTDLEQGGILLDGGNFAWTNQDTLNIWDSKTDSIRQIHVGSNAVRHIHQLPNGIIIASGYVFFEGNASISRDPVTKFFSPKTLEEVKSIEDLEIVKVEPWGNDKLVAMISHKDDIFNYLPIEIWHTDEFVDGLGS